MHCEGKLTEPSQKTSKKHFKNSFVFSSFFFCFWIPKTIPKLFQNRYKIDTKAMLHKIAQKSAGKTSKSLPEDRPRLPKPSPEKVPCFIFRVQDGSKMALGRSWALFPLPKRFLEPLGRLRDAPGALQERFSDLPGPPEDSVESDFERLQPALKKRLAHIPRYSNF